MKPSRKAANLLTLILLACLLLLTGTWLVKGKTKLPTRPNILWITAEDISPDLGCYGDTQARTPNLDQFASEGTLFTNAFSVSGVCAPSRSALITGMYPTSIGTHHMRSNVVPPSYVKCFTEYLRAAGYYCTNSSAELGRFKQPSGQAKTDYQFDSPLTAWDENSPNASWRGRAKNQPFFSVINFEMTHESRIRVSHEVFTRLTGNLTLEDRHDPARVQLPPYYPDDPIVRRDWANYYDLITAMDYEVGELLAKLEEDGLAKNTIVFFFGDHGRGLPRAKRWIYDSGIRVPLMVRWPEKVKAGAVRNDLVSFVDFSPTVLSLAEIKIPTHIQGQAFLGDQSFPPRNYIYAARDRMDETYDIIRAVRDKKYKYIRNFEPGKPYAQFIRYAEKMPTMQVMRLYNKCEKSLGSGCVNMGALKGPEKLFFLPVKPTEELYDTTVDPHEVNNLANSSNHQGVMKEMRTALKNWMKHTEDLGLIPEDKLMARMRPGGKWQVTEKPILTPNGGSFTSPIQINIKSPTNGSSIAYTTEKGSNPRWKLYSDEITLDRTARVRVKAIRLGYKESYEVQASFIITSTEEN